MREHRFIRRRGVLGYDNGAYDNPYPVPVPGYGGEPPAGGSPPDSYPSGYYGGYRAPPATPSGPQIIVLPDVKRGTAPTAKRARVATVAQPAPHPTAHRLRRRASHRPYSVAVPPRAYWPSYAYVPYPMLSPCTDPPHWAIYNTPCGVRPYE
jgi:hypothetical protein